MSVDLAVIAGTEHLADNEPCQDFAVVGARPRFQWAIVADGCSQGGQTELGAKAWATAAHNVFSKASVVQLVALVELQAAVMAEADRTLTGLMFEDGLATLGCLQSDGKTVRATLFGDGLVLTRSLGGELTIYNLQFSDSLPYYPQYDRCPRALARYHQLAVAQERRVTVSSFEADGSLSRIRSDATASTATPWSVDLGIDALELDFVLVCTDGLSSIGRGLYRAAQEVGSVQCVTGEFLATHVAELVRSWRVTDDLPTDDFAVAAIYVGGTSCV